MELSAKETAETVKKYERFIAKCVRKHDFMNIDPEGAAQEGRLGVLLAIRGWKPGNKESLNTRCLRMAAWAVMDYVDANGKAYGAALNFSSAKMKEAASIKKDESFHSIDDSLLFEDLTAVNPERALIALEMFNSLTPEEQAAVEQQLFEVKRGWTKHYVSAVRKFRDFLQEAA